MFVRVNGPTAQSNAMLGNTVGLHRSLLKSLLWRMQRSTASIIPKTRLLKRIDDDLDSDLASCTTKIEGPKAQRVLVRRLHFA